MGQAACGTAMQTAKRVLVADVADSPIFRSSASLEIMLDAGVRSVQSTPLAGKSERVWGMLSTHYKTLRQPRKGDLQLIDYLADWAAALLEGQGSAARPIDMRGDATRGATVLGSPTPEVVTSRQKD